MNLLILDADGVFMNEMPYWKTALAAALTWHGLSAETAERWEALADACFRVRWLQRTPKLRGCNSNWDLAAIMVRALEAPQALADLRGAIHTGAWDRAAGNLEAGMNRLDQGDDSANPPVAGFGIDRGGKFFQRVAARFQEVFAGDAQVAWAYARHELAASREATRSTLDGLRSEGFSIGVCTSRGRQETLGPIRQFGIEDCFDPKRVVTHDDTLEAERLTGIGPLQKPHWFPLACACLGPGAARSALTSQRLDERAKTHGRRVYAGDAPADFMMTAACHRIGLPVEYVHVNSGLTDPATLRTIMAAPLTLGLAADLAGVKALLAGDMS